MVVSWCPSDVDAAEAVDDEQEEEEDMHDLEQTYFRNLGSWRLVDCGGPGGSWNWRSNSARPIGAVDALVVVAGGGGPVAEGEGGCRWTS